MDKTVIKSVIHVIRCLVYAYLIAIKVEWVRTVENVSL